MQFKGEELLALRPTSEGHTLSFVGRCVFNNADVVQTWKPI
jgi:hypothetical protein